MGDEECGFSCFADNVCDICRDKEPGLKIQSAEGFVEEEEIGANRHGTDQCRTLPHTAGEFRGLFVLKAVEPIII